MEAPHETPTGSAGGFDARGLASVAGGFTSKSPKSDSSASRGAYRWGDRLRQENARNT